MKNKINTFLNKKFDTFVELKLTGILEIILIQIIAALFNIVEIEISRQILNFLFLKKTQYLIITCCLFICLQIILSMILRLNESHTAIVRGNMIMSLVNHIMIKNANLHSYHYEEISANDRMSIVDGDCERYIDSIIGRTSLFSNLFTIPFYIIYGLTINIGITILILIIGILLSIINKKNKLKLYQYNKEFNENYGLWANFLWKALDNLEVIKVFLVKNKIIGEHRKRDDALHETQQKSLEAYLNVCLIEESSDIMFTLIILCLSFLAVMHNKMAAASILAMVQALNSVQKIIFQLPEQLIRLHELKSIASRIYKLEHIKEDQAKENLYETFETLSVNNVFFRYKQEEILKGINYTFHKGKFYILTGKSGCGKSTLLKVIARLLPTNKGTIYWNQTNLADMKRDSVYLKLSYISQNQIFLEDTIKKNICFDEINEMSYNNALKESFLEDFLKKNQYNDNLILTLNGWPLSSGERQMVAFANILYHPKQLILLDELFSAIDPAKEQHFFKQLKLLTLHGRTVILVSHRQTNFDIADQILYMENGQISESGSFQELYNAKNYFYTWYNTNAERKKE